MEWHDITRFIGSAVASFIIMGLPFYLWYLHHQINILNERVEDTRHGRTYHYVKEAKEEILKEMEKQLDKGVKDAEVS